MVSFDSVDIYRITFMERVVLYSDKLLPGVTTLSIMTLSITINKSRHSA
jgi:hypothetical protein